ncbi:hypothetical protein ACI79D_11450 [Geodermatophilus sp. SYSU D00708]
MRVPTPGMVATAGRLDLCVRNVWGLTRRRALDFGRVTADG